tara:strand:- start:23 stop:220 length:198 start_codon:yes stop_codon:yes gene_type:complete
MNKIHEKYIELFGSSPHNHSVRIDKNNLTIISDNEVIDMFKDWQEMKVWLEEEQDVIFNKERGTK